MGWGGKRKGAGKKPKPKPVGDPPARVLAHPSVPTTDEPSPIEEFDAPDSLTTEERNVWLKQAPQAFAQCTLTRATAQAFERYCRMVVQELYESRSSAANGPNHRGLRKEIAQLEKDFRLAPSGKPLFVPKAEQEQAPVSKLDRFRRA